MSKSLTVAVAQYDVPLSDVVAKSKLNAMAQQASKQGVDLLVSPETSLGTLASVKEVSRPYLEDLRQIAKENKIAIATSVYVQDHHQFFNQGYIIDTSGDVIHSHRKIYLARPELEEDGISAGSELTVSDSLLGKVGMLLCKDGFTRYSHFLYDNLNQLGAEIVTVPSWSIGWDEHNTQEYIKALYTYGAFTSRAYILVAGNLNANTHSFGRSLIISPINGVLQEGSDDKEELLIERINLDEVARARKFDAQWQPEQKAHLINP